MRSQAPQIVITPDYNWKRLRREIDARPPDKSFVIVGLGARARHLIARVLSEFPEATRIPMHIPLNPREHAVLMKRDKRVLAWGHDKPGKPPIVQIEGADGVVR